MSDEPAPGTRRAGRMRVTPEAEHRMGRDSAATEDEKFLERRPEAIILTGTEHSPRARRL